MDFEGVIRNGVVVPTDAGLLPVDGTTVRISTDPAGTPPPALKSFAEMFGDLCGVIEGPPDLAAQHDHYRLGTPKR